MNSKKIIALAVLAVVLIGLVIGYSVLSKYNAEKAAESLETEPEVVMVVEHKQENVLKLSYTYNGETISFYKGTSKYHLTGEDDFPLDQTIAGYMAVGMAAVGCDRLVEQTDEHFADFGLDDPEFVITAEYDDGTSLTVRIGDLNTFTDSYYLNVEGTKDVYLVSKNLISFFRYGRKDIIINASFPEAAGIDNAVSLKFEAANGSTEEYRLNDKTELWEYTNTPPTQDTEETDVPEDPSEETTAEEETTAAEEATDVSAETEEPSAGDIYFDTVKSLFNEIKGIPYKDWMAYGVTEDSGKLADYGLDAPVSKVTLTYNESVSVSGDESGMSSTGTTKNIERTFTVLIGAAASDTEHYVKTANSDIVYRVADQSIIDLF